MGAIRVAPHVSDTARERLRGREREPTTYMNGGGAAQERMRVGVIGRGRKLFLSGEWGESNVALGVGGVWDCCGRA